MLGPDLENAGEPVEIASERVVKDANRLIERLIVLRSQVKRNAEMLDFALFAAKRVCFTAEKVVARISLHRIMYTRETEKIPFIKSDLSRLLARLHWLKSEYVGLRQRENRSMRS